MILDGEDAAEVNVVRGVDILLLDGFPSSSPDRDVEVNVAPVKDEFRPGVSTYRESDRKEFVVNTPYRPRVRSEVFAEYDHVGLPDLRNWLKYWQGVAAGTRRLTPGSNDTVEMAPSEIAKLRKEIAAREAAR